MSTNVSLKALVTSFYCFSRFCDSSIHFIQDLEMDDESYCVLIGESSNSPPDGNLETLMGESPSRSSIPLTLTVRSIQPFLA